MLLSLVLFMVCAALIFFSGKRLSVYGDVIAEHLHLGKAWIGLVLMASVTSLPELTVGITSVAVVGSADLALGDILGSCVFNLLILSLLDVFVPLQSLFSKASISHVLAIAMSSILVSLVGLGLFLPNDVVLTQWLGLTSLLFIIVYFISINMLYRYDRRAHKEVNSVTAMLPGITLKKATVYYVFNAMVVVGAAIFLPQFAQTIAVQTGLGESFVGTLFLAASTSFPEVAVSYSAIRLGMLDLAVGNLVGSNIFNILILAIDDAFYAKGHLLKDAADSNMISVFSVIIMSAIAIAGLIYRSDRKQFFMGWDTLLIALMYVANLLLLYYFRIEP